MGKGGLSNRYFGQLVRDLIEMADPLTFLKRIKGFASKGVPKSRSTFFSPQSLQTPSFRLYPLIGAFCRGRLSLIASNLACGKDHRERCSLSDNTCNLDVSVEILDDSIADPKA
jgi:hypothetical protein